MKVVASCRTFASSTVMLHADDPDDMPQTRASLQQCHTGCNNSSTPPLAKHATFITSHNDFTHPLAITPCAPLTFGPLPVHTLLACCIRPAPQNQPELPDLRSTAVSFGVETFLPPDFLAEANHATSCMLAVLCCRRQPCGCCGHGGGRCLPSSTARRPCRTVLRVLRRQQHGPMLAGAL